MRDKTFGLSCASKLRLGADNVRSKSFIGTVTVGQRHLVGLFKTACANLWNSDNKLRLDLLPSARGAPQIGES